MKVTQGDQGEGRDLRNMVSKNNNKRKKCLSTRGTMMGKNFSENLGKFLMYLQGNWSTKDGRHTSFTQTYCLYSSLVSRENEESMKTPRVRTGHISVSPPLIRIIDIISYLCTIKIKV